MIQYLISWVIFAFKHRCFVFESKIEFETHYENLFPCYIIIRSNWKLDVQILIQLLLSEYNISKILWNVLART